MHCNQRSKRCEQWYSGRMWVFLNIAPHTASDVELHAHMHKRWREKSGLFVPAEMPTWMPATGSQLDQTAVMRLQYPSETSADAIKPFRDSQTTESLAAMHVLSGSNVARMGVIFPFMHKCRSPMMRCLLCIINRQTNGYYVYN